MNGTDRSLVGATQALSEYKDWHVTMQSGP